MGIPTAYDRVLATRCGHEAADLIAKRRFNRMVVLRGTDMDSVALAEVAGKNRRVAVDHPLVQAARAIGVSLGTPQA